MSEAAQIADSSYADLEPIGKGGPRLAAFSQDFGTESSTARSRYIEWLGESRNLYMFGRTDGRIGDNRPTLNRICTTLNTFTAMATRTDAGIVIKSVSANEDGKWYLKKPFTIMPSPTNGLQSPIPLPCLQRGEDGHIIPLDEAIIDDVPPAYRVCVDTETCTKWAQKNFDIKARECRMFDVVRSMIHRKQQDGWVMGLYQWDATTENSVFTLYELQCWLPDDIVEDVRDMNILRLDVPTDANQAKRMFPEMSAFIDQWATKNVGLQPGNTALPSKYFDRVWARPMIVLCYNWIRNQDAPMTMQEGLDTGLLAWEEQNAAQEQESPTQIEGGTGGAETGMEWTEGIDGDVQRSGANGIAGGPPAVIGDAAKPAIPPLPPRLLHTRTGEDITHSFDHETGEPAPHPDTGELHPNHPKKVVIRQFITFQSEVLPHSDMICPHWDIPAWLDRNIPIIGTPFGLPETLRMASPQQTINNTHAAQVNHVAYFKAPTGIMYRDLLNKISPPLVNGFMEPGTVYTIEGSDDPTEDIRRRWVNIDPPPMPPAIPQLNAQAGADFEIVAGNPGVDNGIAPSPDASGRQVEALQAASQASQGFKSAYTENAIWRMAKLKLHAEVHWMSMREIARINRSIPLELVEDAVLPFLRQIVLDVDVSLPTGSGQIKTQHDAQIRADFVAANAAGEPLLDAETTQDELGYDSEEIARRLKARREELAEEQMKIAQASAPPPPPPQDNTPKLSIGIPFERLTPEVQAAVLAKGGIQVASGVAATLPPEPVEEPEMAGVGGE